MYRISDVKKITRCEKLFWNSIHQRQDNFVPYIRLDETVSELVKEKLKIESCFMGQKNDPHELAMKATESSTWLMKARFEYNGLRIRVPFMRKNEGKWDLYFIVLTLLPKDEDLHYYSSHIWTLEQLGLDVGEIYIIHLNKGYMRQNELDVDELFMVSDCFYNPKGNPSHNISERVKRRISDLRPVLKRMSEVEKLESFPTIKGKNCVRRTKCSYYATCFPNEELLEDDSIMTLVSSQHKNTMFQSGIKSLVDADLELIEGTRQQYAQIMAAHNGGVFVDKMSLEAWLDTKLVYPLSFLDFEWETYAIPPYQNMSPFDVLVFQYSLHQLDKKGKLSHQEFIGTQDCRIEFIENLLKHVPHTGSIIAYNGEGAEKLRLLELAKQFPRYRRRLTRLANRIVDLSYPFMNGLVYDTKMRGLFSLKVLMNVVSPDSNYSELAINHGMDAVMKWRMMDRSHVIDSELEDELKAYCGMDTYAMVLVLKWLEDLVRR